ncbi:ATP-grasp domain-containing protein [Pradoshia sp.]
MAKQTGWLVYNGGLNSAKFNEIHEWYRQTAERKGLYLELVANHELMSVMEDGQSVVKGRGNIEQPDFIVFLDKDIRLARQLEQQGLRLFNRADVIEICDDKTATFQALAGKGIRMPKTIFAPLMFKGTKEEDEAFIENVGQELSYPMVIKEAYGSFGEQVYLVRNREELADRRKKLLYVPHLYQEFVGSSAGRDVRIHVVGGKVIAAMMRVSETDFRANVTNGGVMKPFEPSSDFCEMAIAASEQVGADFSGVDLLFGEDGKPILCEINSNAHIKNIYDCTGIDVTEAIFDHIIEAAGK